MRYSLEEQETFLHFNTDDFTWTIETNYRPHVKLILKNKDLYNILETETDDDDTDYITSVKATINGETANIKPFAKRKRH